MFINTLINTCRYKDTGHSNFSPGYAGLTVWGNFIFYVNVTLVMLFFSIVTLKAQSDNSKKVILQFDIFEEITPSASRTAAKAFEAASQIKADYILIHLNTYGGLLDAADSIRTKILESKIPTIVFIDNNAASAGALISIACNKIYMRSGGSIGAATVVNETGEALPDKYQSYMRSMMRATAEARGRNPKIAEAMVDPRTYIPNVNDSGKVLTFTADEAIKNLYCDGKAESVAEVLKSENISNYSIHKFEPSLIDRIIGFLLHPAVSGVLILAMLGGLYFEMQHPGIGLPLILAVIAAVLYFAPHYMEGLAANWEVLVFFIGMILIALEIFVIPGFGITGIAGIVMVIFGLTFSLINNEGFDTTISGTEYLVQSLAIVIASMVIMLLLFIFTGGRMLQSKAFKKIILQDAMASSEGYHSIDIDYNSLVGKTGTAHTDLRPSGKINIDDVIYTASAESGYIIKDKTIKVIKNEGLTIVVREV